jgi:hypothetical protein
LTSYINFQIEKLKADDLTVKELGAGALELDKNCEEKKEELQLGQVKRVRASFAIQ